MDFNVWTVFILFVAVIALGAILCFRLISNRRQRMAAIAAFSYLAFAAALFYIDVVRFEQGWAVPIYGACFVLVPIAVYYVAYTLGKPDEGAASWGKEGEHSKKKGRKQDADASFPPPAVEDRASIVVEPIADASEMSEKRTARPSRPQKAQQAESPVTDELRGLLKNKVQILQQQEAESRENKAEDRSAVTPRKQRASIPSDSERPAAKMKPEEAHLFAADAAPTGAASAAAAASPASSAAAAKGVPREASVAVEEEAFEPEEPRLPTLRAKASEPAPAARGDAANAMTFERCMEKAVSLKEKGVFAVAARLFAQSAVLADDPKSRAKALFEEISCYIKAGDEDNALIKAADMRENGDLSAAEQIKLDAMLVMLAGIGA